MSCLILAATLALGVDPQQSPPTRPGVNANQPAQTAASSLDGTWTIVSAEKDGQKLGNKANEIVTIRGNVLTWQKEGKEHRVHLQLGANHSLTAWPEMQEQAAKSDGKNDGKNAENQKAGQAQAQNQQLPTFKLPAQIPGQLPGATRERENLGMTTGSQPNNSHHGVYIETSDLLCLCLDQGFENEMHQQPAAAATKPAATTTTKQQPAEQGKTPNANQQQAKAPTPNQPQTPAPNANQQAKAPNQQQPQTPNANQQAKNASADHVETRTANYAGGNMEQKGFVLILRREGGQNQQQSK